jgi:uncharacterized MAPEG superfamily protein
MSKELFWLTLTVLMTALLWLPYVLNRIAVRGLMPALGYDETKPHSAWAERAIKAHKNAVENLIVFAPLVLMIEVLKLNSATTALLCAIYFWTRLVHYLVYTFKIPVLRTLAFAVGWVVVILLALTLLGLIGGGGAMTAPMKS